MSNNLNHRLQLSHVLASINHRHLNVFLFCNHPISIHISAYDLLRRLGCINSAISFSKLTLSDTIITIVTSDDFDEGGTKTKFDLASRAEFLSFFEIPFINGSLLEHDASTIELSLLVKLTNVISLEPILINSHRVSISTEFFHLIMKFFLQVGNLF